MVGIAQKSYSNFGWFGLSCPDKYNITSGSTPDYDKWGPDCRWSAQDWMQWHRAMVQDLGKQEADNRFAVAYDKSSYGSAEIGYSTGNPAFKAYVLAEGLDKKSSILSKVYKAEQALTNIGEPIRNVGEAIGNVTKTAASATDSANTLATWIPWIVLGAGLLMAYIFYKNQSIQVKPLFA